MHTEPAAVRLADLTKHFGAAIAVDRLSLHIEPGELVAFLGPSGCGKTTSLRMIAGLVEPSGGEILLTDARSPGCRCIAGILACCSRTIGCSRI